MMMTTTNHPQNTAARLQESLASLGYLPDAYVEAISQIVTEYVAAEWQDKMSHRVDQGIAKYQSEIGHEIAKYQSGIEHVARFDTSVKPDGYENRVVGYGEEFTIGQPIVTTVENLLQTALRVNTDDACKKHFEAAYDSMLSNNSFEAFNLLAPVLNYGVRPGSIYRSPEIVIAQAAYMLLLIGRDINKPSTVSA